MIKRVPYLVFSGLFLLILLFSVVFLLQSQVGAQNNVSNNTDITKEVFVPRTSYSQERQDILSQAAEPTRVTASFVGGNGSQNSPYEITNCTHLQSIQEDLDAYYVLGGDVNCSATSGWNEGAGFARIGNWEFPFRGQLDGNGYTVSGITINLPNTNSVGVFAQIGSSDQQDGVVKNITFSDVNISGGWITGGAVGYLWGLLDNVHTSGEVTSTDDSVGGLVGSHMGDNDTILNSSSSTNVTGVGTVGGLVGYNAINGIIENSFATGNVISTGNRAGGLVGDNRGNISNSYATGNVNSNSSRTGGLVGVNTLEGEIINSYATGNVRSTSGRLGGLTGLNIGSIERAHATGNVVSFENSVGGLVGENSDVASITQSYATGSVYGDYNHVGGLVGYNRGSINRSYANNTQYFDEDDQELRDYGVYGYCETGGLVGRHFGEVAHITNSYARSDILEDNGCGAGGLVGAAIDNATILQSYATGFADGWGGGGDDAYAGLVGYAYTSNSVNASAWDTETSQRNNACGLYSAEAACTALALTTAQMKNSSSFGADNFSEGAWDFDTIWGIDPGINDGYPYLRNVGADIEPSEPEEEVEEENNENTEDRNNDGTPDSEQAHVNSVFNPNTNNWLTLELDEACAVQELSITKETDNSVQDPAYNYNNGVVNFTADCGTPGYETSVVLYHYGVASANLVVRKHNPNTNAYFTINSASLSDQSINNQSVAVAAFSIIDGSGLDIDGEANGVIKDPVGLASAAAASGALADSGQSAKVKIFLSVMLLISGLVTYIARKNLIQILE